MVSIVGSRHAVRLLVVALTGALLGACAQHSAVSQRGERGVARHAAVEPARASAPSMMKRRVAAVRRSVVRRDANDVSTPGHGVASFYTEGTKTASGEKFNTHDLTAAHPTLPFGTKLRVTNATTGQAVTVRVNDRGPYVPGRVVDVSYADALGMVGKGVAKVKLDVVE
jgi:rare lipoprotein A